MHPEKKNKYSNDIDEWPNYQEDCDHEYWIAKVSDECQHPNSDFSSSICSYDNEEKPQYYHTFLFYTSF